MGSIETDEIQREKSLCQGGADAPRIFNHIFDVDLVEFAKLCQKKKWGYPISAGPDGKVTEYLPIVAFCDNFWILAKSAPELQNMSAIFFDRCKAVGWKIPLQECVWTTTASDYDERWRLVIDDIEIERRSRDDGWV